MWDVVRTCYLLLVVQTNMSSVTLLCRIFVVLLYDIGPCRPKFSLYYILVHCDFILFIHVVVVYTYGGCIYIVYNDHFLLWILIVVIFCDCEESCHPKELLLL